MTPDQAQHLFYAEDALKRAREHWNETMQKIATHIRDVAFLGVEKDEALLKNAEEAAQRLDICELAAKIARDRVKENEDGA